MDDDQRGDDGLTATERAEYAARYEAGPARNTLTESERHAIEARRARREDLRCATGTKTAATTTHAPTPAGADASDR